MTSGQIVATAGEVDGYRGRCGWIDRGHTSAKATDFLANSEIDRYLRRTPLGYTAHGELQIPGDRDPWC